MELLQNVFVLFLKRVSLPKASVNHQRSAGILEVDGSSCLSR